MSGGLIAKPEESGLVDVRCWQCGAELAVDELELDEVLEDWSCDMCGGHGLAEDVEADDDDEVLAGPASSLEPRCRLCGCTNQRGCAGGCVWAAPDLCSRCARAEAP